MKMRAYSRLALSFLLPSHFFLIEIPQFLYLNDSQRIFPAIYYSLYFPFFPFFPHAFFLSLSYLIPLYVTPLMPIYTPPLWSSGQSSWMQTQKSRVRFPALPDFSEYQWVWNGVHSALVRVNEELLERKVAAPV
jgi:hypothetical protein